MDIRWIERAEREGTTVEEALKVFDRSGAVSIEAMIGRWRGGGLRTSHPWDGMLEACGWYGKEFRDAESVFPLLFGSEGDHIVAINPKWLPVRWAANAKWARHRWPLAAFRISRRLLVTHGPSARLRMTVFRGVATATMIYDSQPINDLFRAVAPDLLLGLMDCRGLAPMFFTLRRQ
jgi:hypothetical protein